MNDQEEHHPLRYDVPGHLLQFEEKIFGMTLMQLLSDLAALFGILTLTSSLSFGVRLAVCLVGSALTVLLVHGKIGEESVFSWMMLLLRMRFLPRMTVWRTQGESRTKGEPSSVQHAWLPITSLEHGIMGYVQTRTKEGDEPHSTYWAVLSLESLQNVPFLPESEQVRIYSRFKSFLDGLTFPVKFLDVVEQGDSEQDGALQAHRVALRELKNTSPLSRLQQATLASLVASVGATTEVSHYLVISAESHEVGRRMRHTTTRSWLERLFPGKLPSVSPLQVQRELSNRLSVVQKALQRLDVRVRMLEDADALHLFAASLAPGASLPSFAVEVTQEEKALPPARQAEDRLQRGDGRPPSVCTNAQRRRWRKRVRGLHKGVAWMSTHPQPRLDKGKGQVADLLAPSTVQLLRDAVEIDVHGKKRYLRYYEILGFASHLDAGWVEGLTALALPMTVMTRCEPLESRLMIKKLQMDLTKLEGQRISDQQAHKVLKSAQKVQAEQARSMMDGLERKKLSIFSVQMVIGIHAGSMERLDQRATYLLSHIRTLQLRCRSLTRRHDLGWQVCQPGAAGSLTRYATLPSPALSSFMNWNTGRVGTPTGVYLGTTGTGLRKQPVFLNPWDEEKKLPNPHITICGGTGMGKSWLVKILLLGLLCNRIADCVVLDRDGDYDAIHTHLGKDSQRFNLAGTLPINLLDIPYGPQDVNAEDGQDLLAEFIDNHLLVGLALLYGEPFSKAEGNYLTTCARAAYASCGITTEALWKDPSVLLNEPPVFRDLLAAMKVCPASSETIRQNLLERFENVSYLFGGHTTVSISTPLTIFNISRLDEKWYPLMVYVVQTFLTRHRALRRDERYLAYVIEEASYLLGHPAGRRYMEQGSRSYRKLGIAQIVVSQHPDDFLKDGAIILSNSATNIFLGMQRETAQKLHLAEELERLLEEGVSGRAVIRCGREYAALDVTQATPLHRELLTTDPVEQRQQRAQLTSVRTHTPPVALLEKEG